MKTIQEVITLSVSHLTSKGFPSPRRQVEELLAHTLNITRLDLYMDLQRPLEEKELERCRHGLTRLAKREPIQYILGEVDFFGCKIKVSPDVLIPRQETEILVDKVVKTLENESLEGKTLWDLCCGSGCIGLALKKRFPTLRVVLSDVSSSALKIAAENAQRNELDVDFLEGDLFAPFEGQKADFIVCNPPYVTDQEFEALDPEVRDYEPKIALTGGPTGLNFYKRFADGLRAHLRQPARVWLEMGRGQGDDIKKIFYSFGDSCFLVEQDWSGHDRFFFLEIS